MAKTKTKRWLVQDETGQYQVIERQRTPHKPAIGWTRWRGHPKKYACRSCVAMLLPKSFHLEPGGGPVELPT